MGELAEYSSLGNLAGHVSYVLLAVSYIATNIYWLRVMAVTGLTFEILYFALSGGGGMHTGIAWGVVFVLINLYQIWQLVRERMHLHRMSDVTLLRRGVFAGLDNARLSRLVTVGSWRRVEPGTQLAEQGRPITELILLCAGSACVEVDGKTVARLQPGTFCGEMAFTSGESASATVTVEQSVRAFVFDMQKLQALIAKDDLVAAAIHQAVGRDLAQKLNHNNRAAVQTG